MKTIYVLVLAAFVCGISACGSSSQQEESVVKVVEKTTVKDGVATSVFTVWGNCGMCKKTIETSLKKDGVTEADWNPETKEIKVVFDPAKISLDDIQQDIAAVGYDNVKYKGDDKAYASLHACCQYDRKK